MSVARDIPTSRDSFTAVAAKAASMQGHSLPTPPNSISPSLPPRGLPGSRTAVTKANLEHLDSDLDLQDVDGSGRDGSSEKSLDVGSPGYGATGAITPNLLAKHHLPAILLRNGPLAIRHITGYLTTEVPGFSGIPPAKARRLVVGALEGRGSGSEGAGINGDVIFEKVGWGRWDARIKGQPAKSSRGIQHSPPPSAPSSYTAGMPIAKGHEWSSFDRTRLYAPVKSWADESTTFSHFEDTSMAENEADKMSLDGGESSASSEPIPDHDEVMGNSPEDDTDDEDWAAIGAAALRDPSSVTSRPGRTLSPQHNFRAASYGGFRPTFPERARPAPSRPINLDFSTVASDPEREAIEALLRLSSV